MMDKLQFLQDDFVKVLKTISPSTEPLFGKMNFHQMVEHMAWSFQIASGKIHFSTKQSHDLTEKMHRFMMSDKPFRENTPNPNMPDKPAKPITPDCNSALEWLRNEINDFIQIYTEKENLRVSNPFFGDLNFEEQIHLLYKHALHHLRQFGFTKIA